MTTGPLIRALALVCLAMLLGNEILSGLEGFPRCNHVECYNYEEEIQFRLAEVTVDGEDVDIEQFLDGAEPELSWIRAFAVDEPGVRHRLAYELSPTNEVLGPDMPLDVDTYSFIVTLERP